MASRKTPVKKPTAPAVKAKAPESPPEVEQQQAEAAAASPNAPNVIWRGDKEPPSSVRLGMRTITLPEASEQRAGFYSNDARALVLGVKGYKHFNNVKP